MKNNEVGQLLRDLSGLRRRSPRRDAQHRTKDPIRLTGRRRLQCLLSPVVAVIMAVSACATSWSEQEVAALLEANESALQKLVEEFAQEPRIYALVGVRGRYIINQDVDIRRGPGSKWTVTEENWISEPHASGGTVHSPAPDTFKIFETFEEASGYKGPTAEHLQRWMSEIDALGIQMLLKVRGRDLQCPVVVSITVANYTYLKHDPCQAITAQPHEVVAHLKGPWYYHRLLRGDPF